MIVMPKHETDFLLIKIETGLFDVRSSGLT